MQQVTKERFYAVIGPRDVVVSTGRNETVWRDRYGDVVGLTGGYMCFDERRYWLRPDLAI